MGQLKVGEHDMSRYLGSDCWSLDLVGFHWAGQGFQIYALILIGEFQDDKDQEGGGHNGIILKKRSM